MPNLSRPGLSTVTAPVAMHSMIPAWPAASHDAWRATYGTLPPAPGSLAAGISIRRSWVSMLAASGAGAAWDLGVGDDRRGRAGHHRLRGAVVPPLQAGEEVPRRPPGPVRPTSTSTTNPEAIERLKELQDGGQIIPTVVYGGRHPRGEPERRGPGRAASASPSRPSGPPTTWSSSAAGRPGWRPPSTPPGKASTPSSSTPAPSAARPGSATGSTTTRASPTGSPAPSWPSGSSPRPGATGSSSSRRWRSPPSSATATTW